MELISAVFLAPAYPRLANSPPQSRTPRIWPARSTRFDRRSNFSSRKCSASVSPSATSTWMRIISFRMSCSASTVSSLCSRSRFVTGFVDSATGRRLWTLLVVAKCPVAPHQELDGKASAPLLSSGLRPFPNRSILSPIKLNSTTKSCRTLIPKSFQNP